MADPRDLAAPTTPDPDLVAVLSPAEEFLALYRSRDGLAVPVAVFVG